MMYRVDGDNVYTWYASIENKENWIITQTKEIGKNELLNLL